jgi:hypothetical protein
MVVSEGAYLRTLYKGNVSRSIFVSFFPSIFPSFLSLYFSIFLSFHSLFFLFILSCPSLSFSLAHSFFYFSGYRGTSLARMDESKHRRKLNSQICSLEKVLSKILHHITDSFHDTVTYKVSHGSIN